ncbi:hypothetical protein F5888DRAFT_1909595 [Russula emetica]|nr:hypothetical protein F5888DRAFT_1909595 [Russula emetica]
MSSDAHLHCVVDHDSGHLHLRHLGYAFSLIPTVILYYDYILTFSREVEFFWPHENRVGWVSSLYFLNRYVAIFGHIPIVLRLIPGFESLFFRKQGLFVFEFNTLAHSADLPISCKKVHQYIGCLGLVLQFLVAIPCATRVYALYNKNHYIFTGLIALMIASIAVGIATISTELGDLCPSAHHHVFHWCYFDLGLSNEGGRFLSIAWSGIMLFDIIVFILTIYKATKVGYKVPLIQIVIRDGSLYFFVLFFVNLANILMLQVAPTMLKNFVTPIINVLSSTLVCRMMLRLRSDGNRDSRVTEQLTVLTLSELSGELSSVPPTASVHFGGYGNEENSELKRDWDRDRDRDHERRSM